MSQVHRTELFQLLDKISRGIEIWEGNKKDDVRDAVPTVSVFPATYEDHTGCSFSGLWFGNAFTNRYALVYDAAPMQRNNEVGRYRIMFATNTDLKYKSYDRPNGSGTSASFPPEYPSESFSEKDSFLVGVAIAANLCSSRDIKVASVAKFLDLVRGACDVVSQPQPPTV